MKKQCTGCRYESREHDPGMFLHFQYCNRYAKPTERIIGHCMYYITWEDWRAKYHQYNPDSCQVNVTM